MVKQVLGGLNLGKVKIVFYKMLKNNHVLIVLLANESMHSQSA
jgi:hypothetical protein